MKHTDSNAPLQSRGKPLDFVDGTTNARGRPLVKLHDGPEIYTLIKIYNRDWYALQIKGYTSVLLCETSVDSVVKNINSKRIRAGVVSTKKMEWAGKTPHGNIRGKPIELHDFESFAGGVKKELAGKELSWFHSGTRSKQKVLRIGEICLIPK